MSGCKRDEAFLSFHTLLESMIGDSPTSLGCLRKSMGGLPLINPRIRSELEAGEDGAGSGNASLGVRSRHLGAPLRFGWAPASPELPQPWAKALVPPSCCQPTGARTFYSPASTSPARNHNHDKDPLCVRPSSQAITVILKADVETEFISITHRGSGQLPGFEEANVQAGEVGAGGSHLCCNSTQPPDYPAPTWD